MDERRSASFRFYKFALLHHESMKKIHERKLRALAGHCLEGATLDIGCTARPNPYIPNAAGLDIIPTTALTDNYSAMHICNLNTEWMPVPDASFRNLVAGDLIEHLENPSRFLRDANRILSSGGRLILCTPQANDWWVTLHNWFFRRWINDPDPGEHLQNWTILDMTRLLKKNGFRVHAIEGLHFQMPFLPIRIRARRFPALAWQVMYIAEKTGEPDRSLLLMDQGKRITYDQDQQSTSPLSEQMTKR